MAALLGKRDDCIAKKQKGRDWRALCVSDFSES
jgi:hypothetical protein